jgi:8-amino-7-oxononanoate synthase
MANLGLAVALVGRGDRVYEDRLNHASLLDAGLLSGARFRRYPHGETQALGRLLDRGEGGEALILTDGVFSMDGDLAPLPALAEVAATRGAWLAVDDAHGLGILGAHGGGSLDHFGLDATRVPALVGTLGKAFGTFGAFVAGSADLVETVIQRARTYIYTTAPPPAIAEATRAALRLVRDEGWRRDRLAALVDRFRREAATLGLPLGESTTPIQPVLVGGAAESVALSEALLERGLLVPAIRPPTVPAGSARLRVTFTASHTDAHLDRLLEALAELAPGPTGSPPV